MSGFDKISVGRSGEFAGSRLGLVAREKAEEIKGVR